MSEKQPLIQKDNISHNLHKAKDIVEQLLVEFEHIRNYLEVLQLGFDELRYTERDCEKSSMYILAQYLQWLEDSNLSVLFDLLDTIGKECTSE